MVFQCGDCKYWCYNSIWDGGDCGKCRFNDENYTYKNGSICKKFEPSVGFYRDFYYLMKKAEEICGGNYHD